MPEGINWSRAGEEILADTIDLRRAIHADPEIGLHCPRTTDKIKAALAGLPLEIREGSSTTGFVAILRGHTDQPLSNTRTVLLRGDMDALPMTEETGLPFASRNAGMMHACGHDSHTAMLVGAARTLSAQRNSLPGTVVFLFQPGEEGHHGARHMIADGLLDNPAPDAAFALHILPNLAAGSVAARAGPMLASTDTLHATIHGRGGHAAMPHEALDPIPVLCEIVGALQTLVTRQVSVVDPAVLTVTQVAAGSSHNIIPSSATLLGTLRTLSESTREHLRAAFVRTVEHIAAAHGMTADASIEAGYPATINDGSALSVMQDCATGLGNTWLEMPAPMMGGEDFAYVLRRIPGAMAFLGAAPEGSDPTTNPPLHNTRMTIEEHAMARGIAIHCAVAHRFLETGFD